MKNNLFSDFASLNEVHAIAIGGSRATELFDDKSIMIYIFIIQRE